MSYDLFSHKVRQPLLLHLIALKQRPHLKLQQLKSLLRIMPHIILIRNPQARLKILLHRPLMHGKHDISPAPGARPAKRRAPLFAPSTIHNLHRLYLNKILIKSRYLPYPPHLHTRKIRSIHKTQASILLIRKDLP